MIFIKILRSLLIVACIYFCNPIVKSKPEKKLTEKFGVIRGNDINVRITGNVNSKKISSLKKGDVVKILERSESAEEINNYYEYWYKILIRDRIEGWVFGRYIMIFNDKPLSEKQIANLYAPKGSYNEKDFFDKAVSQYGKNYYISIPDGILVTSKIVTYDFHEETQFEYFDLTSNTPFVIYHSLKPDRVINSNLCLLVISFQNITLYNKSTEGDNFYGSLPGSQYLKSDEMNGGVYFLDELDYTVTEVSNKTTAKYKIRNCIFEKMKN
ncbi:SH3 domain protein [Leptospira broomii serovar Hurstbridge str. 5399]|uniref:SH3 domain protein n=1 Tax=Leptospira broomii serovar Hurstbridge str. 5399 TaxID=1049789 RepID=T0FDB8_9LEPT|nr:SH3 domain-containing protein [Leptospira broomii]EQA45876.1 SH3 domain protein [Leptospira broomii serovar Hurstbridge str. 5399]